MPVSPIIDKQGKQFYYVDSGELEGIYLTVVLVHGTSMPGGIFRRMLPFAAAHKLRLVLVNRRGYPETTPLSESDLDAIASSDTTTRAGYFEQRALELGEFMAWFVQKEKIPTYTISQDNKPEGGIVLLGWSSGTTSTIGLLALQDKVPAGIQAALEPYLRALCIFDTPRWAFGFSEPPGFYHPMRDTSLSPVERLAKFQTWVSGYYAHPDIASRDIKGLTQQASPDIVSTMDSMTSEEQASVSYGGAMAVEALVLSTPPEIYQALLHKTIDKHSAGLWPRCKVKMLWGDMSLWEMASGAWEIERLYESMKASGDIGRALESIRMPGANHFPHWDQPDKTCEILSTSL